ncbi:MAG: YerC/YecD family TrpR-related protein [Patescibacteria group bacterium]|nr:trp operon repressor [Patescibacteria group bacterium]
MAKPTKKQEELSHAFSLLKKKTEIVKFLRDLLTSTEIKELAKRLRVAQLLSKGTLSYKEIAGLVKTSTTTVTRVARWLKHGKGGYKIVLKRMGGRKEETNS